MPGKVNQDAQKASANKDQINRREKQAKPLFDKLADTLELDTTSFGFNAADLSPAKDPGDPFSKRRKTEER